MIKTPHCFKQGPFYKRKISYKNNYNMSERKPIYLCLAHMSEEGVEQKYVRDSHEIGLKI